MTDIVERLRTPSGDFGTITMCREAADEIERLRAVLRSIADYPHNAPNLIRAVARNELEPAMAQRDEKSYQAEIEQLRATVNAQSAAIERADRLVLACEQHLRDARHEVRKLRDDLREAGIVR